MGWDRIELVIQGHVSRHNSDQDITDDYLLEEVQQRIRMICMEHRYESLQLDPFF